MNLEYTTKTGIWNTHIRKLLFVMRLTIVITILTVLQLHATSSVGQEITYKGTNVMLIDLFKEIQTQTGYNMTWNENKIDLSTKVDVDFKNTPLKEALATSLKGLPVTYQIRVQNKSISIRYEEPSFLDNIISNFSAIDVRGTVVDDQGNPLSGATVKVKGTNKSTATNEKGEFYLQGVDENAVLVITYLGFESKEVKASGNLGSVTLTVLSDDLKEVEINAGYYTVKDRERTGSISRIGAETLEKQPISNALQGIQNRMPGVEVTQLTGVPGGGFTVRVRGQNSIGSGNEPLYVVDGVIFPSGKLSSITSDVVLQGANPLGLISAGDIESIEVLKDADATAIYGSRGANGVVLVTTKRGSPDNQKVNFNISQGINQVGHMAPLLNTEQYIAMRMEALRNDGLLPAATDYDVNGVWDTNKYTDWQEKLIGNNANITNTAVNISGGTAKTSYLIGGSFYKEGTVYPGSFGLRRGGVNSNMQFGRDSSFFSATFSANYSNSVSKLMATDPTINIVRAPNAPDATDDEGNLIWYFNNIPIRTNPIAALLSTQSGNTRNLIANTILNFNIHRSFRLNVSLGYNDIRRDEINKSPNEAKDPANNPTSLNRTTSFVNAYNSSWIFEPQLNYNVPFFGGSIMALAGLSFQGNKSGISEIVASNFNSDELMEDIASASVFSPRESSITSYKYAALYLRLNYTLLGKYFFNFTGRRDASSRFGPNKRIANFGAIGLGWIFSQEQALKNTIPFLSFGKLRMSYGTSGNDQINDYQYLQLYRSSTSYQGNATLATSRLANGDYAWEVNKKAEVALELGFFQDKITTQVAYFRNRSSNQLVGRPLAPSVGATAITANLPATVQNTGLELELQGKVITRKDFSWIASINLTIPKNKLLNFQDLETSNYYTQFVIGEPISIKRSYHTYVDQKTGLYAYDDRNGSGSQDNEDRYVNMFLGQRCFGGLDNRIRYKRFNLDLLVSFNQQKGVSLLNAVSSASGTFPVGWTTNRPIVVLKRWQKEGDVTDVAKFTTLSSTNYRLGTNPNTASLGFEDTSFARLKNLSIGYRLPEHWLSHIGLEESRISLQGQNLFTLTKYKGLDPERPGLLGLPPLRTYTIALNIKI